ncbi:DUF559 domain-containing protein [Corynebacterium sp. Marseille-Q4381]|uniref:DUF559 domain-containing protein n=1 Tax=Corynebacterium sp. Marseille-Q4381 TaxID=3121597 RepID=UPI003FA596DF
MVAPRNCVVRLAVRVLPRALLIAAGILGTEAQVEVRGYRVDLLIDGWLVIEIDGNVKYKDPDAERVRQAEFLRQKRLSNEGYYFLRYTPEDIRRSPRSFVDEVKSTLWWTPIGCLEVRVWRAIHCAAAPPRPEQKAPRRGTCTPPRGSMR